MPRFATYFTVPTLLIAVLLIVGARGSPAALGQTAPTAEPLAKSAPQPAGPQTASNASPDQTAAVRPCFGAALLPDDAVLAVTLRQGASHLGEFRNSRVLKSYLDSAAYESLSAQPKYLQAQGALLLFAGAAGTEPWTAVGHLLGQEIVLSVSIPGDGTGPIVLATMRPREAAAADRLVNSLLALSGATRGGEPNESRSREVDGVRGYELNKDAYLAWVDGTLAFANRAAALERLVRQRASADGKLARARAFEQAEKAVPADAVAWAFVDLKRIRKRENSIFDKKLDNALGALLAGGWAEALRGAEAAALWLEAGPERLTLGGRLFGAGGDEKALKPFAVAADDSRDWTKFDIPGLLGEVRLSRGWADLWDAREALIDADGLRGLTEFSNTLTTLMGGLDFSGELLPELRPSLRFLAARQDFNGAAPTPELPAFALLLHLKDPGKLGPRLEQAALMALSIINVDMGQKMQPQFILSPELHNGTKMLVGSYPEALDPGPRGIRYNFQPAVAVTGDQFVVATSKRMLTDIIDALAKLPARRGGEQVASDALTVDLRRLYGLFDANREAFITSRMIADDLGRDEAAAQVGLFLDAARLLSNLSIRVQPGEPGLTLEAIVEFAR